MLIRLPQLLNLLIIVLSAIGISLLYSAADGVLVRWWYKQLILFCVFIPVAFGISKLRVITLYNFAYPIYFVSCLLLIGVEVLGYSAMGATRWLEIARFRFQPSELCKISIVLMLARYFHDCRLKEVCEWKHLILPAVGTLFPALLIIKQPDLGTGILVLASAATVFFVSGINVNKVIITLFLVVISCPIAWNFLHDYQKQRITIFLNPNADPLGSGYNIIQSQIAIGSGGFLGIGFLKGTQTHLDFLPEHQTDFIFALLGEEFGFGGCIIVITFFCLLLACITSISIKCRSVFLKLICQGVASNLFFHFFINIAMVMGLMPVVGIPLPFISYGGSIMASTLISMGLVMNAYENKDSRF